MKALIAHLVRSNLPEIIERSRLHCHAHGLHSIMLLESSGKTIRLFVTDPDHVLHHNDPKSFRPDLSLGFHPHHCDLTLHCVKGYLTNWEVIERGGVPLTKFRYTSALTHGKGGFERVEPCTVGTHSIRSLREGDSLSMHATQIHTVACQEGEVCAWFVFEGAENPSYQPVCYSTADLDTADFSGLYQPATEADVLRLLSAADLLNGGAA